MRAVTATINFQVSVSADPAEIYTEDHWLHLQNGTVNVSKMTNEQKNSYLEAHMEVQQHMQQVSHQLNKPPLLPLHNTQGSSIHHMANSSSQPAIPHQSVSAMNMNHYGSPSAIKVPQITPSTVDHTFAIPDDVHMGYENGGRVLQSLSNWPPDIPPTVPRPNLIPFIEPYIEGGSMHPASRLKALQQVQQASQTSRKHSSSKCKWRV